MTDLLGVDAAVERPRCLEVLLHALLERPRNVVCAEEVFEVPRLGLVDGSSSIHALYDGGHVTEHEGVHQRCHPHSDNSYLRLHHHQLYQF